MNLTQAKLVDLWDFRSRRPGQRLIPTKLTKTQLEGADFTEAELGGVNLTSARNLTVKQVTQATITLKTQLPAAIAADPAMQARIAQLQAQQQSGNLAPESWTRVGRVLGS